MHGTTSEMKSNYLSS